MKTTTILGNLYCYQFKLWRWEELTLHEMFPYRIK